MHIASDSRVRNRTYFLKWQEAKTFRSCLASPCTAAAVQGPRTEQRHTLAGSAAAAGPFCTGAPSLAGAGLAGSAAGAALAGWGATAVADTSMRISGGCPVLIVRSASSSETNLPGDRKHYQSRNISLQATPYASLMAAPP